MQPPKPPPKRGRLTALTFVLFPVGTAVLFLLTDEWLSDEEVHATLGGVLSPTLRKAIDMNIDLSKWFIGLSTALIGGVSYYLKAAAREFRRYTGLSKVTVVGTLVSATLSIFFGHLWLSGIRSQLSNDYYNGRATSVLWPERLQFFFFVAALCWFGLFALERERARILPEPAPPQPDVVD